MALTAGFMFNAGPFKVIVTWKAPCGSQVVDTGKESRNAHLTGCKACGEAYVAKKRIEAEAFHVRVNPSPCEARIYAPDGSVLAEFQR